jgi:hypothetical protein
VTENPWFSARLLFVSLHPDEAELEKVYEDRIVLVQAPDEDRAAIMAKKLGLEAGQEYRNEYGARVIWEFMEVLDLLQLDETEIAHGSEVYSKFIDEEDLEAIRRSLRPGKLGHDSKTP